MAFVKYHVACKSCDSSDAVSINEDGSAKCFSCGEFFPNYEEPTNLNEFYKRENLKMKELPIAQDTYFGIFGPLRDRTISEETAKKFNVRITYDGDGEIERHYYPYYNGNEVVAYKVRQVKTKSFTSQGQMQKGELFGQQICQQGGKYITITEGECDAMAAYELTGSRWPVVSVKSGAQAAPSDVKKNYEFLNSFENIIVCFDNDRPGREAAKKVAGIFPPNKAKIMSLPADCKDPNDMLRSNRHSEFVECFWQAKTVTPAGIIRVSEKLEDWKNRSNDISVLYPWEGLNNKLLGMRKGELLTVAAGTGTGKSSVVRELEHWLLNNTEDNVGIIALEEDWRRTVDGIIAVEYSETMHLKEVRDNYTDQQLEEMYTAIADNDRLFVHAHFGINDIDEIFTKLRYLISGCDCKWIVLDHLHMLVSAISEGDERRLIDNVMTKIRALIEETGVGFILVSHLRKLDGNIGHENGAEVSASHLRGSNSIGQISDCIIALERNQQSDDKTEANTTRVRVLKSRYTGDVGIATYLLYDHATGRLKEISEPDETLEFERPDYDDIPF